MIILKWVKLVMKIDYFHGSGHPFLNHISMWHRYVDDIFCIWAGPVDSIQSFLDFRNDLYPSENFFIEIGGENMNFPDITITTLPNKLVFEIYRKTTTTDTLIHGSSFCPFPTN